MWIDPKEDIKKLLTLDSYNYCEVTQIVLIPKTKSIKSRCINYFTHVEFDSSIITKDYYLENLFDKERYKTDKLQSVNKDYSLAIRQYCMTADVFIDIYNIDEWKYQDDDVIIDNAYNSGYKFVPESNPIGGKGRNVYLEQALYGSNHSGNYYIQEIFSTKANLSCLSDDDIAKIDEIIEECHISFSLLDLKDRIGNIICKFRNKTSVKAKLLGNQYGIKLEVSLPEDRTYSLMHAIELDGLIYDYKINSNFRESIIEIEPHAKKITIIITDNNTGLIKYGAIFDYSIMSDYNNEIFPPGFLISHKYRELNIEDKKHKIKLINKEQYGVTQLLVEEDVISQRRYECTMRNLVDRKYFNNYSVNSQSRALEDIKDIINNNICYDLLKIDILDPYIQLDNVINNLFFCKAPNIKINIICDFKKLRGISNSNNHLCDECRDALCDRCKKTNEELAKFCDFNRFTQEKINTVLGIGNDISFEMRSIRDNCGYKFHDRFLILRFHVNRSRVWSLGTSFNALGKQHHIIQAVNNPERIVDVFDDLWNETSNEKCLVAKYPFSN